MKRLEESKASMSEERTLNKFLAAKQTEEEQEVRIELVWSANRKPEN